MLFILSNNFFKRGLLYRCIVQVPEGTYTCKYYPRNSHDAIANKYFRNFTDHEIVIARELYDGKLSLDSAPIEVQLL